MNKYKTIVEYLSVSNDIFPMFKYIFLFSYLTLKLFINKEDLHFSSYISISVLSIKKSNPIFLTSSIFNLK